VDDGSTDDTAPAVRAAFPDTQIIPGNGQLYWAGGMALAEDAALRSTSADFLLWVNDDVDLYRDGLQRLVNVALGSHAAAIVVGTLIDPHTGKTTYGGLHRDRWRPMHFVPIEPGETAQVADTFTGNLVLVPRAVAELLGGIDRRYSHGFADLDYGLRARVEGIRTLAAPGIVGACTNDHVEAPFNQPGLRLRQRIAMMYETRNLPWRARMRFLRRHGGPLWPMYVPSVYLRLIIRHLVDRIGRSRLAES
jgi:GT2 family glycosyltransferase